MSSKPENADRPATHSTQTNEIAAKPLATPTVKAAKKPPVKKQMSTVAVKSTLTKPAAKAILSAADQASSAAKKPAGNKSIASKPASSKKMALAKPQPAKTMPEKSKTEKIKMERDSFTMPKEEYAQIAILKKRMETMGKVVKKSELLRAGLKLLAGMTDVDLQTSLVAIPVIKTGRPKKKH